jgi:hypothetical protein
VSADDLVAREANPHARDLRATVGIERDEVRERVGFEQRAGTVRELHRLNCTLERPKTTHSGS